MSKFLIDGIDRLGKGTLIHGIINHLGYHTVIHLEKPKLLDAYFGCAPAVAVEEARRDALAEYQHDTFHNMFYALRSDMNVIFDRTHLGECVYAPMYRDYSGDYVFEMEEDYWAHEMMDVRLILLTEDFQHSKHFVDDGLSFDPTKRQAEQELFIDAFNKSTFPDKLIICVTDTATGQFRDKNDILAEVLGEAS